VLKDVHLCGRKIVFFLDLSYWEVLEVRNAIDVMHLTKNLCVNLLSFLGVYGKPKETLETRKDLQRMKQRAVLHPEKRDKGQTWTSKSLAIEMNRSS
jgi:hypothetical protein